jgi:hypothetical protein
VICYRIESLSITPVSLGIEEDQRCTQEFAGKSSTGDKGDHRRTSGEETLYYTTL